MGVPPDHNHLQPRASRSAVEPPTATLLSLPTSRHHSVRSVAQEAFKTLWADEPDRAERWRRIGNMDQLYGVGRPLGTITKEVIGAVFQEMLEMGMPGDVVRQHLEDFATLMFWADAHGFVRWTRAAPEVA